MKILDIIEKSSFIIVGVGAGLSTASGLYYSGERFEKYFADFHEKYGIEDMYQGGFYSFPTLEEYWARWSRHIYYNRYDVPIGKPYSDLLKLLEDKNYFVITTNVDHQLQKAGFEKSRLFYMQGDYGLWQCSLPCHNKTYDNKEDVIKMIDEQKNMKIPSALIPHCPICHAPMTMNLRIDDKFVQDEGWYEARDRYKAFLEECKDKNTLFLELGVGSNTPAIIKYPFMQMAIQNINSTYVSVNMEEFYLPKQLKGRGYMIKADIKEFLEDILI